MERKRRRLRANDSARYLTQRDELKLRGCETGKPGKTEASEPVRSWRRHY